MILTVSTSRPRRRNYHHGDLPAALIAAALEIVEESGVGALTLRGVARRVGVSHAAPAHHFRDRRALIAAVAVEGFRLLHERISAETGTSAGRAALRACGRAYIGFAVGHPARFRVMFSPELADKTDQPELAAAADATHGLLLAAVRDAQALHQVRGGDPESIAALAWATVHGYSWLVIDRQLAAGGPSVEDILSALYLGLSPVDGDLTA
jgi:AcrR family transcriptional regulator